MNLDMKQSQPAFTMIDEDWERKTSVSSSLYTNVEVPLLVQMTMIDCQKPTQIEVVRPGGSSKKNKKEDSCSSIGSELSWMQASRFSPPSTSPLSPASSRSSCSIPNPAFSSGTAHEPFVARSGSTESTRGVGYTYELLDPEFSWDMHRTARLEAARHDDELLPSAVNWEARSRPLPNDTQDDESLPPEAIRDSHSPRLSTATPDHHGEPQPLSPSTTPSPSSELGRPRSSSSCCSTSTTGTRLEGFPFDSWTEPYNFEAMEGLGKEIGQNGWPLNDLSLMLQRQQQERQQRQRRQQHYHDHYDRHHDYHYHRTRLSMSLRRIFRKHRSDG